jgi:pseudouridine kinase
MRSDALVLLLGGANLDITATGNAALHTGDSSPGTVRFAPGGVARNVAENLARLGHGARLVSAVGDDAAGHQLLSATRAAGVDVSGCRVVPGATTSAYVSVHGGDGELLLAVNDMALLEHLTLDRLAEHSAALHQAAAIVVDANLPEPALAWVFANAADTPVFADAVSASKCVRLRPWLARLHLLKLNRLEAQVLCGLPQAPATRDELDAAARRLVALGVRHLVLSAGADGVFHRSQEADVTTSADVLLRDGAPCVALAGERAGPGRHEHWHPALRVDVLNNSGAGDALLAGLVHAHLQSTSLADAVRFASGCAAMTLMAASANHAGLSVANVLALLAASPAMALAKQAQPTGRGGGTGPTMPR